jgi:hypothetical protein
MAILNLAPFGFGLKFELHPSVGGQLVRTSEAVDVLRTMAGGAEDAYEARAALRRMKLITKTTKN